MDQVNPSVPHTAKFDGLGRRLETERAQGGSVKGKNSGNLDGTTRYYYNQQQIIETNDGSGNLVAQMYHGTQHIDEPVGLRLKHGRVYVHQDANYNVTNITDLTGRVLERYYYSPYGELEVSVDAHFFDYDDDGDVDEADVAAATSGGACWNSYSGDCRRLDADADRDIDANDYTAVNTVFSSLTSDTAIQRIPAAMTTRLGNLLGHQGPIYDAEIGSYQNRARHYSPYFRRFLQRDPLGPVAGINHYAYAMANPIRRTDPTGLTPELDHLCFVTGQPPQGANGSTVCDGQGGFMNCVNHCCTVAASSNCTQHPNQLSCIRGYPPPNQPPPGQPGPPYDPCPPPPSLNSGCVGSPQWCQALNNSCVCKGEQNHTTMFLQYNPDACQGRAPGEIPVVANDNGSPGTYSYWYRNLSEVNALITAQNCIGDNAAGTACGEAMVTSLQPIIDAHYSAYIANCQGFNPGAPHAPAP